MNFDNNKNLTHIEIKDEYKRLVTDAVIEDADTLIMVGLGLAGAYIILGNGELRKEFSPKFKGDDAALVNFYRHDMQYKLDHARQLDENTPYKKVFWVVSPDMCISAARYRIGDEFVNSGAYVMHKRAYLQAFHESTAGFKKIQFIFHDDKLSDPLTGFTLDKYKASANIQDIHCSAEYYKGTVNQIKTL